MARIIEFPNRGLVSRVLSYFRSRVDCKEDNNIKFDFEGYYGCVNRVSKNYVCLPEKNGILRIYSSKRDD